MSLPASSSLAAAPDAAPEAGWAAPRPAAAVFAVLSAMTLVVLDAGVANMALPALGEALQATPADAILVVTAYQAGLMMALLPAGGLGERFGHRRVFTLGVALFAAASGLCALAPSLPWLVAARLAQGFGGAAIMAVGLALLRLSVPAGRLGAAIGWNALTVALASAAAPGVGAAILSVAGWPALFGVNLPLAAVTLAAARALPAGPDAAGRPDFVSMALNALAFGFLVLAAESAVSAPDRAVVLFGAGALGLALLVRREAPKRAPLVPLDLLRSGSFRLSATASVCCFAGQSMALLALPYLLQQGLGQTPLATGLYLTAWPLSVAVTAIFAGRLADRLPTAWLCAAGGGLLCAGLAGLASLPPDKGPLSLVPFMMLAGMGFGLFQSPNNRNLLMSAPVARAGAAGGMQGAARVTGQTLGSVAVATLFSLTLAEAAPRTGLAVAAGLALLAGLASASRIRR